MRSLIAASLALIPLAPLAAEETFPGALRVVVVPRAIESGARDSGGGASGLVALLAAERAIDHRIAVATELTRETLAAADAVVLESADGLTPEVARELRRAVDGGLGLVVCAGAARGVAGVRELGELVGRVGSEDEDEGEGEDERGRRDGKPPSARRVVVEVSDQSHAVTQSVAHFVHAGEVTAAMAPPSRSRVLARRAPASGDGARRDALRPCLWTVAHRRGRVLVSLLDHAAGPSRGLVETLVARAAQWSSYRQVTVTAREPVRFVAEELGPEDDGLFPGVPPEPGHFRGRRIARFMTFHGASWLTRASREREEEPERVLDSLGIRAGSTVVDLGSGNGYFTLRLAKRVGERGTVLAVEIQREMLALLERRAREAGIENVRTILAEERDPKLPAGAVDLVLMVDVYHELSHPRDVMRHVARSLAPGGRVVLVEYRGEDPTVAIKPLHRVFERQAIAELAALGFRWVETKRFLRSQHVLVFERAPRQR